MEIKEWPLRPSDPDFEIKEGDRVHVRTNGNGLLWKKAGCGSARYIKEIEASDQDVNPEWIGRVQVQFECCDFAQAHVHRKQLVKRMDPRLKQAKYGDDADNHKSTVVRSGSSEQSCGEQTNEMTTSGSSEQFCGEHMNEVAISGSVEKSYGGISGDDQDGDGVNLTTQRSVGTVVLVTPDTLTFRALGASQCSEQDYVLEIGCSTGELSRILVKRAKSLLAVDISPDMIEACKNRDDTKKAVFLLADALASYDKFVYMVASETKHEFSQVYIDIGGDRRKEEVIRMIQIVHQQFNPSLILVKSKKLHKAIVKKRKEEENQSDTNEGLGTAVNCGRSMVIHDESWLADLRNDKSDQRCKNPLKYPIRLTQEGVRICRYHNYDVCMKGMDPRGVGSECPFDHDHCNRCGVLGHRALECGGKKQANRA